MAYATVSDLQAYWRVLSASEQVRAESLLEYAALFIDSHVTISSDDETQLGVAKFVSCDLVKTAMFSGSVPVSSVSQTGGVYSASMTFANPQGDMFWKSQYDSLFGLDGMDIGSVRAVNAND